MEKDAGNNLIGYDSVDSAEKAEKVVYDTLVISQKIYSGGSGGWSSGGSWSGSSGGDKNEKPSDKNVVVNKDGSTTTTTETTDDSGNLIKTEITNSKDGSSKSIVTTTAKNGNTKKITTLMDKNGDVKSVTENNILKDIAKDTSLSVTVKKNKSGDILSAKATVDKVSDSSKSKIDGSVVTEIRKLAGTDVIVNMKVVDSKGDLVYTVATPAKNLKSGKELYVFKKDNGSYTMVNGKTYTVSKAGSVSLSLKKDASYELVTSKEKEKIEKLIKATVKPKKAAVTSSVGKKVKIAFSKSLNIDNVKKISYSTTNGDLTKVSKQGTVLLKKKGTSYIKAKVMLKNGSSKTVKVKITAK